MDLAVESWRFRLRTRIDLREGQCSDFTGAEVLLRDLPPATALIGGKEYHSNVPRQHRLSARLTGATAALGWPAAVASQQRLQSAFNGVFYGTSEKVPTTSTYELG